MMTAAYGLPHRVRTRTILPDRCEAMVWYDPNIILTRDAIILHQGWDGFHFSATNQGWGG